MSAWFVVLALGLAYFHALPFAAVLQGAGYRVREGARRAKRYLATDAVVLGLFLAVHLSVALLGGRFLTILACGVTFVTGGGYHVLITKKMRMHAVYTRRLLRLLVAVILINVLFSLPLILTGHSAFTFVLPPAAPFVLALAAFLLAPFERRNNLRYVSRAREKLAAHPAVKIGITGSYGKTSVKNYLEKILSSSFACLATPANFNTPLGIAKSVGLLEEDTAFFIAEMGARHRGDVEELADMVRPSVGIITGIAPQHLETFGSLDAIVREKGALSDVITEGTVYFNVACEEVRGLYERRTAPKVSVGYERADAIISDVVFDGSGSRFVLSYRGREIELACPLVGRSAVENVAIAAVAALDLGVSEEGVIRTVGELPAVPHRLEIIRRGDLVIIDDSYNINPVGARAALETLAAFTAKRRVVYTSGMVELGKEESLLNEAYGREIARVCDVAIIAEGRQGDAVARGIKDSNTRVLRVRDTAEATTLFGKLVGAGDVLLITSDLPRDYSL